MNKNKIKRFKKSVVGYIVSCHPSFSVVSGTLSVGHPSFSVVSGILSVGHPSFSVVSGILSVVGIPPVPVPLPEEIQLLMYGFVSSFSFNILSLTDVKA